MNLWFAKAAILLSSVALVVIRAPYGQKSHAVKVVTNRKGPLEKGLLALAWIGFFVPIVWVAAPVFSFAEYALRPEVFAAGVVSLVTGLWIFARSHADLGTNWSVTLELRENHALVTEGIYRRVRHPMYLSLLLYSLGQALVLPNYVAGPFYGVAMVILIALRLDAEERLMREHFGAHYDTYAARTRRLVPGVW